MSRKRQNTGKPKGGKSRGEKATPRNTQAGKFTLKSKGLKSIGFRVAVGTGLLAFLLLFAVRYTRLFGVGVAAVARPVSMERIDPVVVKLIEKHLKHAQAAPQIARRHGTLGLVYEANGLWHAAQQSYAHAAELAPDDPRWPYHRGVALQEAGDIDGAVRLWRAVLQEKPDFAACHQRLGTALLKEGKLEEASTAFQHVVALKPNSPLGYVGLGQIHLRAKDLDRAIAQIEKAVALDPSYKQAHYLLGLAYRSAGRPVEAQRQLSLGIDSQARPLADELSHEMVSYAVNLQGQISQALSMLASGQTQRAVQFLQSLNRMRPHNAIVLTKLAYAYGQAGKAAKSLQTWREAAQVSPGDYHITVNLAIRYLQRKNLPEALKYADLGVQQQPHVAGTHTIRAEVLMRLKRFDEALEALKTASQLDARTPQIYLALANLHQRLEQYEQARDTYRATLKLFPENLAAQLGLSSMCLQLGQLDEGEMALTAARKLAPNHPRVAQLRAHLDKLRKP